MIGRILPENDKKRSKLDKLGRDQDVLHHLQLHGLEGTDQGKLTKEVLTTTIKQYNTSSGKLKVAFGYVRVVRELFFFQVDVIIKLLVGLLHRMVFERFLLQQTSWIIGSLLPAWYNTSFEQLFCEKFHGS